MDLSVVLNPDETQPPRTTFTLKFKNIPLEVRNLSRPKLKSCPSIFAVASKRKLKHVEPRI